MSTVTRKLTAWLAVSAALFLFSVVSRAQVYYGTVRGTVLDLSGAVMPGVEVVITNVGTNISQRVTSNEVGNYVAPNLIPGVYRVTAEKSGFKKFVADDIQLTATADRRIDIHLAIGSAAESVRVEGGAQLIETENGILSDVKSREVFTYVPVNAEYRSIWNLVQLAPGVNGAYGHTYAGAGDGGNDGYDTNFTIDGIPVKDGWTGWTMGPTMTYIDSYSEMRVNINGTNASSGQSSEVAVVSESGTNRLHLEAWLHYNAVGFRARDFFDPVSPSGPPTWRPNFQVGGPVILPKIYNGRNRTFFFFSWQGLRGSQSPQTVDLTVPSADYRAGMFPSTIIDPQSGQPFPGNTVPASRISPVSKYYQDTFYPAANTGLNRYRNVKVFAQGNNSYATRLDHKLTDKNSLFFRILVERSVPAGRWDSNNPLIGVASQWRDNYLQVLSDTHVISPTMVNEFRVGHSSDESYYAGPNQGHTVVAASGLQLGNNLPDVPAMPAMNITGYNSLAQTPQGGWLWSTYHLQDSLFVVKGKHNLHFGTQISQYLGTMYPSSPSDVYGSFTFDGRFSGNPYADFLLGLPSGSSRRTSVSPTYPHRLNKEFYVTDDWKVTPRLTLTVGLRYTLLDPGTIAKNVIANFNVTAKALAIPASAQSLVAPEYKVDTPIVTADKVGLSDKLLNIDRNNFAPRFGFAWCPGSSKDLVIRGGGGVYYVGMQPYISDGGDAPYEINQSFTNSVANGQPLFAFPNPFPTAAVQGGSGGFAASGMNPKLSTPYSMQANFTVEKKVLGMGISASVMTTMARHTVFWHNLNAVPANTTPFNVKYASVPYPFFFAVNYANNGGTHNYRAGYIKAERNFSKGLYYQAHLTWAKSVGDDFVRNGDGLVSNEDPFNRARDRAMSAGIPPFRAVVSFLYNLPFGKGKRFGSSIPAVADYAIGGWRISGNYQWENGTYFTPYFAGSDPSNTNTFGGRPDCLANGNLSKSQRTMERYFDTAAFAVPPDNVGRFGSCGANILEGPGLNVFNLGLLKEITMHETYKLKLEAVSSNVFNHPSFDIPDATLGSPTYGMVVHTRTGTAARDLSLTVRLAF